MTIPRNPTFRAYSVIYTDAYFKLQGVVYCPGDENLPQWDSNKTRDIENGWAALCFHQGDVHKGAYFQGRLPSMLLRQFSADQAFIYLLEAWAATLAPMIFEPWLGTFYVQCCDNEASRHALIKGVGKHQPLNCFTAAHWPSGVPLRWEDATTTDGNRSVPQELHLRLDRDRDRDESEETCSNAQNPGHDV
ncbi:hypothetical protein AK812_SmicGene34138 [Symbiodinium microadriaticum]|uniref:Uncharacterized protein n=1 Tax=Symbiodinium microadriaticum TaxID=2951 RepID=A0A1Q9CPW6_SYMMI|nr:hypothetical protein AK812_SmicGene34138 [Symbiodinium microadriaticum]